MLSAARLPAINIPVGDHVTRKLGGLEFNLDTIWTTGVACIVVIGMAWYLARNASVDKPGRLQLFWEFVVETTGNQVENTLGPKYRHVVPLGITIFMLILVADWLEILPGIFHNTDYSPAPTADVNLTYALGITVFIMFTGASIRAKGIGPYVKHYFRPPVAMAPLNIIEEVTKPLTLALRLFGNLFSGGIMIALLISFPFPKLSAFGLILTPVWKLFDMFIGAMQAFIFALLTLLYYQFAVEEGGH
ncbi:MAG TPA: F0F1 ATP synthase subunit A [Acidimicrobiales bacterium]|jgi:F-type H+-transporting ATPase subunit a|nr:F0F1 ATP synthase subunit A [Acidimicrobiales bacterium]